MGDILIVGASGLGSKNKDEWRIPIEMAVAEVKTAVPEVEARTYVWNKWKFAKRWIEQSPGATVLMMGHSNGVFFMLNLANELPERRFRFIGALDKHLDLWPIISPPARNNIDEILEHHARLDRISKADNFGGKYESKEFNVSHTGILSHGPAMRPMVHRMIEIAREAS